MAWCLERTLDTLVKEVWHINHAIVVIHCVTQGVILRGIILKASQTELNPRLTHTNSLPLQHRLVTSG